jgi:hypothetical protein
LPERVGHLEGEEEGQQAERTETDRGGDYERQGGQEGRERERRLPGQLPARDRAQALERVQTVLLRVQEVVGDVRGARSSTVGEERRPRLQPPATVAELGREDDPRKQQQVFVHCSGLNATSAAISGGLLADTSVTAFEAVPVTAADGVRLLSTTPSQYWRPARIR